MVTRQAVLAKAHEWLGMKERTGANDVWFADDWGITGYDWCAAFVQSCFYYAEPSPTGKLPHESMYVPYFVQWARDHGESIEVEDAHLVQPGDVVMFTWDQSNWPRWQPGTGSHVGLVRTAVVDGWFGTIEGNVGRPINGVLSLERPLDGSVINFWRPPVYTDSLGPAGLNPEELTVAQIDTLLAAITNLGNEMRGQFDHIKGVLDQGRVRDVDEVVVHIQERLDHSFAEVVQLVRAGSGGQTGRQLGEYSVGELLAELAQRPPTPPTSRPPTPVARPT